MKKRIKFFILANITVFILWIAILFAIQILKPYHEFSRIITNRIKKHKVILYPWRGNIYDRNGELLVTSDRLYQVDLQKNILENHFKAQRKYLKYLKNEYKKKPIPKRLLEKVPYENMKQVKKEVYDILVKYSGLSKERVKNIVYSKYKIVSISDKMPQKNLYLIKKAFKEKRLKGLYYKFNIPTRVFINNQVAARVLGGTELNTYKNGNKFDKTNTQNSIKWLEGKTGIEASFNEELKGKLGYREEFKNALRQDVFYNDLKHKNPLDGDNVYLNIDLNLQKIVEGELKAGLKRYEAKMGMGIIMNPNNGKILAMASVTNKDNLYKPQNLALMSNIAASYNFEPGSVLKPVTALLAIEKNLVKENEKIDCRYYKVGDRIIKDDHKFAKLTLKEIIAHSSNIGISKVAAKVGKDALYERLFDLGFGHSTGSDFYNEGKGILREVKDWSSYSLASISFGQEISVTTLQLANAYCALANGGTLYKPLIADKITDSSGKVIRKFKPKALNHISNKSALNRLKSYLSAVVEFGTGTALKNDYVTVAGKTGTAQKREKYGYSETKYMSIFAGFFPVDKPKYVMVIVYDEPNYYKKYYYGAQSALPTFKSIMFKILDYYDNDLVIQHKLKNGKMVKMPNLVGNSKYSAKSKLDKLGLRYKIVTLGDENIVTGQYPKAGILTDKDEIVKLVFGKKQENEKYLTLGKMPNLVGKSLVEAIQIANRLKFHIKVKGNGVIKKQIPQAGQSLKIGEICKLYAE